MEGKQMSQEQAQALQATVSGVMLVAGIVSIALIIFSIIIYWKIFSKAGYSGALGLLMLVPIANIIMLCVLAFGEWPIYRELNQLRQQAMGRAPQYPQNPPYPQNPQYR
jgi:hypothetical protein